MEFLERNKYILFSSLFLPVYGFVSSSCVPGARMARIRAGGWIFKPTCWRALFRRHPHLGGLHTSGNNDRTDRRLYPIRLVSCFAGVASRPPHPRRQSIRDNNVALPARLYRRASFFRRPWTRAGRWRRDEEGWYVDGWDVNSSRYFSSRLATNSIPRQRCNRLFQRQSRDGWWTNAAV